MRIAATGAVWLLALFAWVGVSVWHGILVRRDADLELGVGRYECVPDCPGYDLHPLFVWRSILFLGFLASVIAPGLLGGFGARRGFAFVSITAWFGIVAIVPMQYYLEYDNGKGLEPMKVQVPEDIARFRHPWCKSWVKDGEMCRQASGNEVVCDDMPKPNAIKTFGCSDWDAPNWCIWWTDSKNWLHRRWPFDSLEVIIEPYYYREGLMPTPDPAAPNRIYCLRTIFG
ncbi:MAG: hypothetical protein R3D57_19525 [Hyphomicrobiaceae bacterium]